MKLLSLILLAALSCRSAAAFLPPGPSRPAIVGSRTEAVAAVGGGEAPEGEEVVLLGRRAALARAAGATAAAAAAASGGLVLAGGPGQALAFGNDVDYFGQVRAIENANNIGDFTHKKFPPNSRGSPAQNLPQVKLSAGGMVTVSVPHKMETEDYIKFIWLKDVRTGENVVVKGFPPTEKSPPTLQARCPVGVRLQPCSFGIVDGLWKGEEFTVTA